MGEREDQRDLSDVRDGRRRLRHALDQLEDALARPAGRPGDEWHRRAAGAVERFQTALGDHVAANEEEEGGLFADVLDRAPRLSFRIERLRAEHDEMAGDAHRLLERCRARDDADDIRRDALALLRVAVRHRQLGADLLYEAYEQDIAAGD